MAKTEAKALAKQWFLQTNKTQEEIAKIVKVTNKTMSGWVKEWKPLKQAHNLLPDQQVATIYTQLEALDNQIKEQKNLITSKQSDIKKKLTSSLKDIQSVSLKEYVLCYEELITFLKPINLSLAQQLIDHTNEFLLAKAEQMND